jgi:transposase-like protein
MVITQDPKGPVLGDPKRSEGERSETSRSVGAPSTGAAAPTVPQSRPHDPEVVAKPLRRRFTAEYKLRVLRDVEQATKPGEIGAILRREGLYSSLLSDWRRQRREGSLMALAPRKRGRKSTATNPLAKKLADVEREKVRLEKRLKQAETIIDFQKKVSELLGIPLSSPNSEGSA